MDLTNDYDRENQLNQRSISRSKTQVNKLDPSKLKG